MLKHPGYLSVLDDKRAACVHSDVARLRQVPTKRGGEAIPRRERRPYP